MIKDICKLNDDFYLAYISLNDSQLIYFLDGENESWEYPEKSISFSSIKYLKKIGELDAYVGDFTYTETNQVLYIDLHPAMNWNRFCIVNGKRGFIINTIGNIFMESGAYKMNTAENGNSNLVFFLLE